jgi:hypothetical protein
MAVLEPKTKAKLGGKAAKTALEHPRLTVRGTKVALPAAKLGTKASRPLLKRRARRRTGNLADATRSITDTLAVYAAQVAYALGLAEPPKSKRTGRRLAAGVVVGAAAVYFLEPKHGREHREQLSRLVG